MAPVRRFVLRQEVGFLEKIDELFTHEFIINALRHESQTRDGPIVPDFRHILSWLLYSRFMIACCWQPFCSDALYVCLANDSSSGRNSFSMLIGIGSNEQNFDEADGLIHSTVSAAHFSTSENDIAGGFRYACFLVNSCDLLGEQINIMDDITCQSLSG